MRTSFRQFAHRASAILGSPWAFGIAMAIVVFWAASGWFFHFSNTWQLVINTGTTIVTFLMVFLIQNTQNRDSKAINLKLDELIRSAKGARDSMLNLEDLSDSALKRLHKQFQDLRDNDGSDYDKVNDQIKEELDERHPAPKRPH